MQITPHPYDSLDSELPGSYLDLFEVTANTPVSSYSYLYK
jgi:hypothetical protein